MPPLDDSGFSSRLRGLAAAANTNAAATRLGYLPAACHEFSSAVETKAGAKGIGRSHRNEHSASAPC